MKKISQNEPQTIASWTHAIAMALEMQGQNSAQLFEEADIPYRLTSDPGSRIEAHKIFHLMKLAVNATGNPGFGLVVARNFQPANFHALGFSLYSSCSLYDFCQRLVHYSRLISDNVTHYLHEDKEHFRFVIELVNPNASIESLDGWLGAIVHICRGIYRPDFSPLKVEFERPVPKTHAEDFERFFRAPVTFSEPTNTIYFAKADMLAQLPSGSSDLARRNDEVVIEYLARLDREDIVRQVEAKVIELLPTGECSKDRIASLLHISRRKLHNKLEQKNTSYQEILENLRSNLAKQYIEQKNVSFSEIAFLLGFTDTSNFARAFRRWTGVSPTQYRDQLEGD
ncbi:MAG: AraC family transcriptional regulator [Oleispira sp.]|nr:AraC family transcriptional regulator [Oleispira sp.]|tara:strand:+ start:3654 stop:4676 length:1023 start_codon:yes stop_codon:yes gene_type:complete